LEKVRSFIAINFNPDIIEYLASLKISLNFPDTEIKWIEKSNLHLTIKFLGYVSIKQIELIKSVLGKIIGQYNPFLLKLSSDIGVFPTYRMPRIVWVGIKEGTNELKELYDSIEGNLFKNGFPREGKEFSSHITIGRVKFVKDKTNFIQISERIKVNNLSQKINSIDLMESKLTSSGPIYSLTAKFPFLNK